MLLLALITVIGGTKALEPNKVRNLDTDPDRVT